MLGFWISSIASPLQALEVFRLRSFDLVIVDDALGGFGAAELVRRLRGLSDRNRTEVTAVPVVAVMSGDDARADESSPYDAVLIPPLDIEDLAVTLMEMVREWRAAHPTAPAAGPSAPRRRLGHRHSGM